MEEKLESILKVLEQIKDLLQNQQQTQTKITVVGNKPNSNSKGLKSDEDFSL